jgi:Subtilase family
MLTCFVDRTGRIIEETEMPTDSYSRNDEQRRREREQIQPQIDSLKQFPTNQGRQRAVLERLASGREARGLPPFSNLSTGTLPEVPVLALREFLVRQADRDRPEVQEMIATAHLSWEPVTALGGEVGRLTRPGAVIPDEEFRALAAGINTALIAPSLLVPLGGWSKGEGGPEHTEGQPERQPSDVTRRQVAVIDTGLGEPRHDWLHSMTNPEIDPLYPPDQPPNPDPDAPPTLGLAAGHGTFVAGIVQQVEPSTDIRMYRALDIDGLGADITVGAKIEQAARDGAQIINLSLGTQTVNDSPPPGIETGIRRAIDFNNNILIVCAAGNYGGNRKVWPAAFSTENLYKDNVVAVAGLNPQLEPQPEWSTHGEFVQFSTVAEGIVSTYVRGTEDSVVDPVSPEVFEENDFAIWTGTSFAAPQIVGKIASICRTEGVEPIAAVTILKGLGEFLAGYGYRIRLLEGT